MSLSIIACMDKAFGIGFNNKLLAHMPNDLKRFKQLTKNKFCIMGRKTYESVIDINGEPLQDRVSIVLTSNKSYSPPKANESVLVYNNLDNLIFHLNVLNTVETGLSKEESEIMVCGGSTIYEQLLPYVDKMYLTIIHHKFEHVDSYFPRFKMKYWNIDEVKHQRADGIHKYDYSFMTLSKKN